jgi:PilZ domain
MKADIFERRQTRRRQSTSEHGIVSVRVRPGIDAVLVDVSTAGALLETCHRLLPGTFIDVHFARDTRVPVVRGRVVRCAVAYVGPDRVSYRGAILFDRRLTWLTEESGHGYSVPISERRPFHVKREFTTRDAP